MREMVRFLCFCGVFHVFKFDEDKGVVTGTLCFHHHFFDFTVSLEHRLQLLIELFLAILRLSELTLESMFVTKSLTLGYIFSAYLGL